MLYLSTRNKADSFTPHRVLCSAASSDCGVFMPMCLPVQSDEALAAFEEMNFGASVASILNLFFGTQLTGWDVGFAIGRQAVDLVSGGYKVSLAESWHNPAGTHSYLVKKLHQLVLGEISVDSPNLWFQTAVNIALLFGIYGKFCRQEVYSFDVAVEGGDLQLMLAARYAQKMGLPIRKIILGCVEGDGLWDLLSYGDYSAVRKEPVKGLEALLWLEFGYEQTQKYLACLEKKTTYHLRDLPLEQLRKDVFSAVVGDNRVKNVMDNILSTNNYLMESSTARAFGALQDYRAKTGENKNTLLFSRNVPVK